MSLSQPIKTYRDTWDQLMGRRNEIAPDAMLKVKVFAPEPPLPVDEENQALITLLRSWREEDATDDREELERRDIETNDLMTNSQANRLSLREPEV